MNTSTIQWLLLGGFMILMIVLSPVASNWKTFFQARSKTGQVPGKWLLVSSLVISWIFAKSITNAANLGLTYGIVGGVAYATYYLSFLFAGVIIYQLRTKGGYSSIHDFLTSKYGRSAVVVFSVLIGFRLFNEVWSNTMVIGSYFGDTGSMPYYLAIIAFTGLTLFYSLRGGLQSSMFTDAVQMVFFGVLLLLILGMVMPQTEGMSSVLTSGTWTLEGGLDLLLVALIQVFSYPFHDPVMTDRGFLTDPKTTLKAFAIAVPLGFVAIVLFSLVGVYAAEQGMSGQAAVEVSRSLGTVAMLLVNFIMITSAASTLDSAFASFSKLIVIDLGVLKTEISTGRLVMAIMAVVGTIPVFLNPTILSATTISGTMVIGLAPIFLFWRYRAQGPVFVLTVVMGVLFGIAYATEIYPESLIFWNTRYGALLSVNLVGTVACFVVFFVTSLIYGRKR